MRKYLLLYILLSFLPLASRGQTIENLDLSGLPQPTQAKAMHYWFDDDDSNMQTISKLSGKQELDVSTLIEGLHTLHYQVIDSEDNVAYVRTTFFLKTGAGGASTIKSLRYWFDDDNTNIKNSVSMGIQTLDISTLLDGLHTVHYQLIDRDGMESYVASAFFLKTNNSLGTESVKTKKLMYWFDDETDIKCVDVVQEVQLLDASGLIDGLHTLHYQVLCNNGQMTPTLSSLFLKSNVDAETPMAKSLRYWFDEDAASVKMMNVPNGTHTLDVSALTIGLHTLNYQLIDKNGNASIPVKRLFLKNFEKVIDGGENRITKYQYWLNRNSQAMQTVEFGNASNPCQLISLLPMQKEPIQSDCFHFEVTDGVPTVYAKDILHIRFWDAQGYFSDGEKAFVDYSVKQEVRDAEMLKSGIRATTATTDVNTIRWYSLNAEPGDSLRFRLDCAATIQLFAPSGKEVYSASGVESVQWGGLHVWETGTYYLALHDVTATQSSVVSIDYEHIDKYAILRQDVAIVGNGGYTTITFFGNGFKELFDIDIVNDAGDSITCLGRGFVSDSEICPTFDFTDAKVGVYNAYFHFTGEDRFVTKVVTVENAKELKLDAKLDVQTRFLGGERYKVVIVCPNGGNNTAYDVPLEISFESNEGSIKYIDIKNPEIPSIEEAIDKTGLTAEEQEELQKMSNDIGDTYDFLSYKWSENGRNKERKVIYLTNNIPPNSSNKIELEVEASEDVVTGVKTPIDWLPLVRMEKRKIMTAHERHCCNLTQWKCWINSFASYMGMIDVALSFTPLAAGSSAANCSIGGIARAFSTWTETSCNDVKTEASQIIGFGDVAIRGTNKLLSWSNPIISCLSSKLNKYKDFLAMLGRRTSTTAFVFDKMDKECHQANEIDCNEDLNLKATSRIIYSRDPNEIYGYTAESGHKAIKNDQTDLYYRIEFENDPEFATAAAHYICVTDTLDATKFDLSTYEPTRIKIGEKSAELTGDKNFITTIDMRPEINAIAQVTGTYDEKKGIAKWYITSLDPMTMEPTTYVMDGVLPVNTNGNGIGEVSYNISLKSGLSHGTEIHNRAGIVFDHNETIMTPTWTNVIDAVAPTSHIIDVAVQTDSTATVSIEASDELSGVWRYDVYVQYGTGSAWWKAAENVPAGTAATVKIYEGMNNGFYVVATDSAGNVERKEAMSELSLNLSTIVKGDANYDQAIDVADVVAIVNYILGEPNTPFIEAAADVTGDGKIDVDDIVAVVNIILDSGQQNAREMMLLLENCGFRF